tara:strand:- start:179 stop:1129 length:951 start_codon:yes stop_codon:yes gene_type:complete
MINNEQIAFFRDNGYLILPGAMDLELCARARDNLWASLPDNADIKRDDPASHFGPLSEKDTLLSATNMRSGHRWQLRDVGTDRDIINLVYSETLIGIAEQLLGTGTLRRPIVNGATMGTCGAAWPDGPVDPAVATEGARGIYCTLPYRDQAPLADGAHTDGHPFMLSLAGLIDDNPPGGGALTVWPKSHRRLYPTYWMQYDQARIPFYQHMPSYKGIVHSEEYQQELAKILADTQPIDCWGNTGDVVIWHHRLVHMAGENHSNVIRQSVLADFSKIDLDKYRSDPPQADMWRDWSEELRSSAQGYTKEFARSQRLI